MNKIKNTLFTFAGQLLLACAVALLTQPATQAQTPVNVVNTPTVRIDSRANEVKVVNSPSSPVPVRVIEEPLRIFVHYSSPYSTCSPIPIPQGRWAVVEHVAVAKEQYSQVSNVTVQLSYKDSANFAGTEKMYDVPLNDKGRGLLQLKFYVKGESDINNVEIGDTFAPQICFTTPMQANLSVIVSGHLLPQ